MPIGGLDMTWGTPVRAMDGGLCISRGRGQHPTRIVNNHELILIRRGRLGLAVEDRVHDLGPGDALVIPAGLRHGGTSPYPEDLEFFWLHFTIPEPIPPGQPRLILAERLRPSRPEVMEAYLRRFLDDQEARRPYQAGSDALVALILAEAARTVEVVDDPGNVLAQRACQWMMINHHRRISTRDVAAALGCHPDHLGRVFRRVVGRTVIDELLRMRLQDAERLLLETCDTLAVIARIVGFSEAGYLRRVFRRHFGMPPDTYRQRHARLHINTE
jgi:AraC-like DNA-binding protein